VAGFLDVKAFLKVVLLVLVALLALKLLPLAFGLGCILAAALLGLLALGASVIAALFAGVVMVAAVLAPIWVPVLIVVGLVALLKRRKGTVPTVAA
jgi:hypothetical protein